MKRSIIAATIAALTIPVVAAVPAHASETIHVRVDPRDWAWNGTITLNACKQPIKTQNIALEPNSKLQDVFQFEVGVFDDCELWVEVSNSTFTGGNATYQGVHIEKRVAHGAELNGENYFDKTGVDVTYVLGEPDEWELKIYPSVFTYQLQSGNVTAAADVNTGDARSSNAGHITLNPNRVTAMAQRFVNAPGDLINIHGYGPDRDKALSRANHVRDHLLAEITRLGGNADAYPVMVVYGGDPDHKKNTHVTIHQHAASNITVPEGGTLTIGGNS